MLRRTFVLAAPAALPLLAALGPAAAGQETAAVSADDVRWDFAPGDAHVYEFDLDADTEITQFGQTTKSKHDIKIVQAWDVKSVNRDGSAVVNKKIERVVITSNAGGTETKYDSAAGSPEDGGVDPKTLPANFRVIAQLAGQTIPSVVAADGTVKKVTLPEAVTRAVEAAGPTSTFGEEQVKLLFTDRGYTLPPAGTNVGGDYTDEAVLPLQFGTVKDSRTMTLKSLDAKSAVIDLKTTLSDAEDAEGDDAAGPMTVTGGTTAGTVNFDVAAGRLADMDMKQTIELTGPGGYAVKLVSESTFARAGGE